MSEECHDYNQFDVFHQTTSQYVRQGRHVFMSMLRLRATTRRLMAGKHMNQGCLQDMHINSLTSANTRLAWCCCIMIATRHSSPYPWRAYNIQESDDSTRNKHYLMSRLLLFSAGMQPAANLEASNNRVKFCPTV